MKKAFIIFFLLGFPMFLLANEVEQLEESLFSETSDFLTEEEISSTAEPPEKEETEGEISEGQLEELSEDFPEELPGAIDLPKKDIARTDLHQQVAPVDPKDHQWSYLKMGTPLYDKESRKWLTTGREIYCNILTSQDENGLRDILNKDGTLSSYKVHWQDITKTNLVTKMLEPPVHFSPALQKKLKRQEDEQLKYAALSSLKVGQVSSHFWGQILGQDTISGQEIGASFSFFTSPLPWELGLYSHLTRDQFTTKSDEIVAFDLALGPEVKLHAYSFVFDTKITWSPLASADATINAKNKHFELNIQAISFGVNKRFASSSKVWNIGLHYSRRWIKLLSGGTTESLSSNKNIDQGILLSVGLYHNWF